MAFDPNFAAVRFGTGRSPAHSPPQSVEAWLKSVNGQIESEYPFYTWDVLQPILVNSHTARKNMLALRRSNAPEADQKAATQASKAADRVLKTIDRETMKHFIGRGAFDTTGFATRLTLFWADHFSAQGKGRYWTEMTGDYLDTAIRPHVLGRFEDMLVAVLMHPLMLHYLDQTQSVGPNSTRGRQKPGLGVNENLAREVMELHTLGVGGPYTQEDVQSLALVLTGMTANTNVGFRYRAKFAEPGPHALLGQSYGDERPALKTVVAVAKDLARHPATARHLALKMAKHFVSDTPSEGLVAAMVEGFGEKGSLADMTEAMLRHADAWNPAGGNVKWSLEFMMGVMRAMNMPRHRFDEMNPKKLFQLFQFPLRAMGQPFFEVSGPDGLMEEDADLMRPHILAARLDWALRAPDAFVRGLPDPRKILPNALAGDIPKSLRFAVKSAESRHEGLAMIFVSPAFQRR